MKKRYSFTLYRFFFQAVTSAFSFLSIFLYKENKGGKNENRPQNTDGPKHVAEEAGHLHTAVFSNGTNHKVRSITNIRYSTHKYRTGGNCGKRAHMLHKVCGVAAGGIEEYEVGRSIVQE